MKPQHSSINVLWVLSFAALFVGLMGYVGAERVLGAIVSAEPLALAAGFGCYATFFLLRGHRWSLLLRSVAPRAQPGQAAAATAAGWMISTYVPFKAGDVARVAMMAKRQRASLASVGGTVAIERALDVMGLAIAASTGLLLAGLMSDHLPQTVAHALLVAWILPVVGLIALVALGRWVPRRAEENFILRFAHRFLSAARALGTNPRRLPALLLLSILVTMSQVGIFVFLFQALRPASPWIPLLAGVPLFLLSFIVSVTPGQVGTYEAAFVAVFAMVGFPQAELLPMAVACHALTISFVTTLGSLGLLSYRIRDARHNPTPRPHPRIEREADA